MPATGNIPLAMTSAEVIELFQKILEDARRLDANDYCYGYEASWDYNPEPLLPMIRARLLAINFADDLANALELGFVEGAIAKIPNARSVVVPAGDKSHGHFGSRYPDLWKHHLVEFLESINRGFPKVRFGSKTDMYSH